MLISFHDFYSHYTKCGILIIPEQRNPNINCAMQKKKDKISYFSTKKKTFRFRFLEGVFMNFLVQNGL